MSFKFVFFYLMSATFLLGPTSVLAAKKTFVFCSEGSPSSFNPQLATDGTSFDASSKTIYDRLVNFKYGETTIVPSLASKWDISKNGLEYTFTLRKGVKFHHTSWFTPSRDFNADDVLFSFNRMREKTHPYHSVGGGNYEYFESMEMGSLIKDIIKVDNYKVRFILTRPEAPFLADLAMDFASILSAEYAQSLAAKNQQEEIDRKPIGTGPFVFNKYVKDNLIRYDTHKNYFQGPAKIDQLVFSINPQSSVRYQKLKTGECDLMAYPSPQDIEGMKKDSNLKVLEAAGLNVGYLGMNMDKKPFSDLKVRKAINYALNKESYIKAIYLGQGKVAKNPLPPTMWSFNNKISDYDYNPELAKKLLHEAGYDKGFDTELWALPVPRPYIPDGKKMAEMMQADLAKVGIRAKIVSYDWPTYLSKTKNGEHQLVQMGWTGDNGDPDNFLGVLLSCPAVKAGSNLAHWCSKRFDKLVEAGKRTSNMKVRTQKYEEAQKVFHEEVPWVTLANAIVFRAQRKNVVGYKIDPFGTDYFYYVDFK